MPSIDDIKTHEDLISAWVEGRKPSHASWKDRRAYETGALTEPDKWTWVEHPSHSDYYSKQDVAYFLETAIAHGVDPYDFLALGISESGLGSHPDTRHNPTRVDLGLHFGAKPEEGNIPSPEELIDFSAEYLAKQFTKYKDRAKALQAYSGTGTKIYPGASKKQGLPPNITSKKFFGKQKDKINAWRDQPQAKRTMSISDSLKKNEEIKNAVDRAFRYWREE